MAEQNTSPDNTAEETHVEVTETSTDTGDENALGDAGKRALDAERRARKEADKRVAEAEKRLEEAQKRIDGFEDANRNELEKREHKLKKAQEQLEAKQRELDALNHKVLTTQIAADYNLPADMASRLQGNSEEELREDAEKLQALIAPRNPRVPLPVLQEGADSGKNRTAKQAFADAVRPFLN